MEMFNKNALSDDDVKFATELYNGSVDNLTFTNRKSQKYSVGFKLEEFSVSICNTCSVNVRNRTHRHAACRLRQRGQSNWPKNTPTQKSLSFVNGLLGEYIQARR